MEFESRYRDLILRYALARGVQHADAEDICQGVMMSLARSLRSFRYSPERGRFRDYLGWVVRNAVARFWSRPQSAARSLLDDGEPMPAPESPETDGVWEREWVDHHYRLALRCVRQTFDPRSVAVFEQLLDGGSVSEVAVCAGLTDQAVHKIKQRIRDRMRELIAAQIREEDEPHEPPSR